MTTKSAPLGSENTMDGEVLTDFDELELKIAGTLGVEKRLPINKNLFDGGCLCHTYPKDSDRACGNHATIIYNIRKIKYLIAQEANKAVTSALAKHVLAGMPGLTPRQQDYITKVLAKLTDKKGKADE